MGLGAMPLFAALTEKMRWHQARQGLLAENVANSETPGYRPRDLKPVNFADHLRAAPVRMASTKGDHIVATSGPTGSAGPGGRGFRAERTQGYEITPEGNGVVLEDQMMKVTANQMDYQAITTLYTRSLRLIRTALGRQA
jgi:flagellar basal-body rod protein FlgB